MKKIKFLMFLLPIFLFTGCFNYRELNEIAIVSALGLDKTSDGYIVTIQVMNTKKASETGTSNDQPKFITFTTTGVTLQDAIRKSILDSSRRIYPNHVQTLIIGEDLAKSGISDVLDMFFRGVEFRKQTSVLIAKDSTAEDVLNIVTPLESLNSKNIEDGLSVDSKYLGIGDNVSFEDLVGTFIDSNKEIILPSVSIVGKKNEGEKIDNIETSDPSVRLLESSLAVFKGDHLIGFLDNKQSIDLNFVRNKINNTILTYECGDNKYLSSEIMSNKTSVEFLESPLKAQIKINGILNINEITCDIDLEDPVVIDEIEEDLEEELKNDVYNTIKYIIEEYNSDVFGFRDFLYKNKTKYYKEIKDDWYDSIFPNMDIDVDVNLRLTGKGNALKVITRD